MEKKSTNRITISAITKRKESRPKFCTSEKKGQGKGGDGPKGKGKGKGQNVDASQTR